MAKQVIRIDDMDGVSRAEETVRLGLGSKTVELDLSTDHYKSLKDALEPFLEAGTPVRTNGRTGKSLYTAAANRERNTAIREWAAKKKMKVSPKGRIPLDVIAAFEKANSK